MAPKSKESKSSVPSILEPSLDYSTVRQNDEFICLFLEEFDDSKRSFEINWPLALKKCMISYLLQTLNHESGVAISELIWSHYACSEQEAAPFLKQSKGQLATEWSQFSPLKTIVASWVTLIVLEEKPTHLKVCSSKTN